MPENVRPEPITEIASILARGFRRCRKSRRLRLPEPPQNDLASASEPSRHVTVVNDQRTDEN